MYRAFRWAGNSIQGILIFVFLTSCAHKQIETPKKILPAKVTMAPGEVKLFQYPAKKTKKVNILCNGKSVPYYWDKENVNFYWPVSYFEKNKTYTCKLSNTVKMELAKINIKQKEYPFEVLKVNRKRVFLSKKDQRRVWKEQKMLNKIYAKREKRLFKEKFYMPLDSYITSPYGMRRMFNKKKRGQHLGTDFRAKVGTKIPTSNRGKVVFSGNLFYTGNTVIVSHGLKIFTVYAHLSKRKVKKGQIVDKGTIIGLAGKTGRVTGPHLHWGVKIMGHWISGESLVKAGT